MASRLFITAAILLSTSWAEAQSPAFNQLSEGQAKSVIKEFSANFTHTTVSGASPLGTVFGVEVGLAVGLTKSDEIAKLTKLADPSSSVDQIPHGGLVGIVSVPFGFTFEGTFIPKVGSDDFQFKTTGLGLKWTLNSVLEIPVSVALKAHYSKTDLMFKQTVSSVTSTVDFTDTVTGLMLLVSKDFIVVEPYLGIGTVAGEGSFSVSGTTQFFQSGVTTYSAKETGSQIVVGVEAQLLIFKLAAEYANNFGASGYNAKLALSF